MNQKPKQEKLSHILNFGVDDATFKVLQRMAHENGWSMSTLIRWALKRYIGERI